MDKKSFIVVFIGIAVFIVLIIWRNTNQNELKKNGILVEAKVLRVNFGGKTGGGFQCFIKYKNEEKEIPSPSSLYKGKIAFIGKIFPAMYLPDKEILEILITPQDFEKFNIPFPDSLNWVMPYVGK